MSMLKSLEGNEGSQLHACVPRFISLELGVIDTHCCLLRGNKLVSFQQQFRFCMILLFLFGIFAYVWNFSGCELTCLDDGTTTDRWDVLIYTVDIMSRSHLHFCCSAIYLDCPMSCYPKKSLITLCYPHRKQPMHVMPWVETVNRWT